MNNTPKKSSPPETRTCGTLYGALPQMRLLTYQMPDDLLAIAGAGEVRRIRPRPRSSKQQEQASELRSNTKTTCKNGWKFSRGDTLPRQPHI
jgi:hypothetical protein